jgi:hypothetical protein
VTAGEPRRNLRRTDERRLPLDKRHIATSLVSFVGAVVVTISVVVPTTTVVIIIVTTTTNTATSTATTIMVIHGTKVAVVLVELSNFVVVGALLKVVQHFCLGLSLGRCNCASAR